MTLRRWLLAPLAMMMLVAACTDDGESTTTSGGTTMTTAATTSTTGDGSGTTEPTSNLPDLAGRTITVAVDNETFPFNFTDNGVNNGWDYEAFAAICEALNCQIVFDEVAEDAVTSSVAQGAADVAGDASLVSDPASAGVDFSNPILPMEQRLVVRADETRFNTVSEFSGSSATVGAVTGTANHQVALDTWGTGRTRAFPTLEAAIAGMIGGEVDAVVIFDYAGQGYVGTGDQDVKQIEGVLGSGELALIFTPGSDLVEPFNQALLELTINGTLGTLNTFWFAPASAS